jgi:phospholipid/cholesterol/gamma-HCH transport system permease protein
MANPAAEPQLVFIDLADERRLELRGPWNLHSLARHVRALTPLITGYALDPGLCWDLTQLQALDHAGALLLWRAWGRKRAAQVLMRVEHEAVFDRLNLPASNPGRGGSADIVFPLVLLGNKVLRVADHLLAMVALFGQIVMDLMQLLRKPGSIPWREISANVYRAGTQALGITALVGFLVGVVLSYLSAQQLKLFGADAFIINILGISIMRELGPVLAAILIAGRSGSAITAQVGVMRVTEELDAMAVMGIPYSVRLVLPKVLALGIAMPLIVLWTNAIALIGGMVSAHAQLDIGYVYFFSSLADAVPIANLWLGLGKGAVFGFMIALVACHFGFRIQPNTESLGIGTTDSVVTAITVVIVVDAIFAIMFKDIGII